MQGGADYLRVLNRIFMVLIIIMIPLISVTVVGNIMTRLPDIYSYEFTKSQIPGEIGLEATAEELSALFSDYLTGDVSEFQIISDYQGREKAVFTTEEQIGMQNIKKILDRSAVAAIIMCLLTGGLVYYFVYRRQKERLRNGFRISVILYLLIWGGLIISANSDIGWLLLQQGLFAGGFDAEGVLGMLLAGSFIKTWLLFNIVGSAVVMLIIGTAISKVTKERRMFVV
jgi:uncharacterized membrane protein